MLRLMLIQKNMNAKVTNIFGDDVTKPLINVKKATIKMLMKKYLTNS